MPRSGNCRPPCFPLCGGKSPDQLVGVLETQRGVGTFVRARQPVASVRATRTDRQRELRSLVERILTEAYSLGFSLDEVATLLNLEDGKNRRSIRSVAAGHLAQIESRIADLKRMEASLSKLITDCADNEGALRCPIIAALSGTQSSAAQCARATRQSVR